MKVKITYPNKLGHQEFAKTPIVDVETIDSLKEKPAKDLTLSIVGIFYKKTIKQIILKNPKNIEKFRYIVKKELAKLPQPFLAFNKRFDKTVLKGFTGISYRFKEIQEHPFQKKQKAKEKHNIKVKDPFNGDGLLAIHYYNKYLQTGNEAHLNLVIDHNLACLLTEHLLFKEKIAKPSNENEKGLEK